ncbi:MAG TPA: DUF1614 domain-containing protein [Firmicutes bacterium]|nr:DUF1614 domain-containing protein [Candidatus Fermentithermobacillaceae bacterium]
MGPRRLWIAGFALSCRVLLLEGCPVLPLYLIVLIILGLPALFFLLFFNVGTLSLARLGLSPQAAFFVFALSLVGSVVNIPVVSRRVITRRPFPFDFPFFFFYPPEITEQVIAVNVGGAVVPVLFSIYLIPRIRPLSLLIGVSTVTLVAYSVARPVPGRGILMPAFVPPLVAAGVSMIVCRNDPAPLAYVSGTLGTLIGADLLHLPAILRYGSGMLSIGGAGVYDGIFLVGILAALLA